MEKSHPLDSLIGVSHLPLATKSSSERLIKAAGRQKRAGGFIAALSSLFGASGYYVVRTANDPHDSNAVTRKGLILEYKSTRQTKPFRCTVDYTAWCRNIHAERLVEYYAEQPETFGQRVDDWILRAFADAAHDNRALTDLTVESLSSSVERLLENSAGNHPSGLDLRFSVVHGYYIPGRELAVPKMTVLPKDSSEGVEVEGDIHISPVRNIALSTLALADSKEQFEQKLRETLKGIFLRHVSAIDIHRNFGTKVVSTVERELEEFFAPFGLAVVRVNLRCSSQIRQIPSDFTIDEPITVPLILEGFDGTIVLRNLLLLQSEDPELYLRKGAPDLKTWAHINVHEVVRDVLFGEQYVEVLSTFETYRRRIRELMEARANRIGYHVRHLTSDPDTPDYSLLKKLVIASSGDPTNGAQPMGDAEVEFPTKESKISVSVSYAAYGKLRDLKSKVVQDLLRKRRSIVEEMNMSIRINLGQILHEISPEEFYTRFYVSTDTSESVQQRLIARIRKALDEFGVDLDADPVVKMGRTEIVQRLEELRKELLNFEVPLSRHGSAEEVTFRVALSVDAIPEDQYPVFALRTIHAASTIDELRKKICETLKLDLANKLASANPGELWFQDENGRRKMHELVERLIVTLAKGEFGLLVRLVSFGRLQADWEAAAGELRAKQVDELKKTQLHLLEKQGEAARSQADKLLTHALVLDEAERMEIKAAVDEHLNEIKTSKPSATTTATEQLLNEGQDKSDDKKKLEAPRDPDEEGKTNSEE